MLFLYTVGLSSSYLDLLGGARKVVPSFCMCLNLLICLLFRVQFARNAGRSLFSSCNIRMLRLDAHSVLVVGVNWSAVQATKSIPRVFNLVSREILLLLPFPVLAIVDADRFFKIIRQRSVQASVAF